MGALTVPHARIHSARELRALVANCWRKSQAGERWVREKARVGLLGTVRACEVTHGENGWHPHLHILFFIRAGVSEEDAQSFGAFVFARWSAFVHKAGYGECNPALWRFERTRETQRAGDYVTKWGCDRELTQGHTKLAKGGGRTPWQLLQDFADKGDARAASLFAEFADAFKGARQLTWSRGLRERYSDTGEIADEQLADAEEPALLLGTMTPYAFKRVVRAGAELALLEAAERHGQWGDVLAILRTYGIDPHQIDPARWKRRSDRWPRQAR